MSERRYFWQPAFCEVVKKTNTGMRMKTTARTERKKLVFSSTDKNSMFFALITSKFPHKKASSSSHSFPFSRLSTVHSVRNKIIMKLQIPSIHRHFPIISFSSRFHQSHPSDTTHKMSQPMPTIATSCERREKIHFITSSSSMKLYANCGILFAFNIR